MPSYWIQPRSDIDTPLPEGERDELSETFYGLIGAGTSLLFDAFPPVFTQIQCLVGIDIDELLPLYVSYRMTEVEDLPREIERVAKDLATVRSRFHAFYQALLKHPQLADELSLPTNGYAPTRDYFEHFEGRPRPVREQWEIDAYGELEEEDDEPYLGGDLRFLLRYLDHASCHGGTRFWFLGR